ncbi:protein of unknown function [Micropruina glycogenica]|uniref:Uncharacterized protein n=1 Tax=Micropruina glycogenica TaxID=75385 RepID=A0A2N9JGF7_9ACTN|nr:protein of unknown function [Micropruina glycogenica]
MAQGTVLLLAQTLIDQPHSGLR